VRRQAIIFRNSAHNSSATHVHSLEVTSVLQQSCVTFAVSVYCAVQSRVSRQRHVQHVRHDLIRTVEKNVFQDASVKLEVFV